MTVNSDDPTMFGTDVNNEYLTLRQNLGFTIDELFSLSLNGIESSFLDQDEKDRLKRAFYKEFERLLNQFA